MLSEQLLTAIKMEFSICSYLIIQVMFPSSLYYILNCTLFHHQLKAWTYFYSFRFNLLVSMTSSVLCAASPLGVPLGPPCQPHSFCSAHLSPRQAGEKVNTGLESCCPHLSSFNFLFFMVHLASTRFCLTSYIIQLKSGLAGF